MKGLTLVVAVACAVLFAPLPRDGSIPGTSARAQTPAAGVCRPSGTLVTVPGLREGSGIAASRARPGVLWAHNDSADPALLVLNESGAVTGRVGVTGAQVEDWEDVAVGPCPEGSCIYIGDIGDNDGSRQTVTVYRVPEPGSGEARTRRAIAFHARYPDGAHDAESLFVTSPADVFIVTKGDPGPVALYRFPQPLAEGTTARLERVGKHSATGRVRAEDRPTAADVSPDGRWAAVRTTRHVTFYRTGDLLAGGWKGAFRVGLGDLGEPRGEGIALGSGGSVFLLGEGAGRFRGGTFARLTCAWPE